MNNKFLINPDGTPPPVITNVGRRSFLKRTGAATVAAIVASHFNPQTAEAGVFSWLKNKWSKFLSWVASKIKSACLHDWVEIDRDDYPTTYDSSKAYCKCSKCGKIIEIAENDF